MSETISLRCLLVLLFTVQALLCWELPPLKFGAPLDGADFITCISPSPIKGSRVLRLSRSFRYNGVEESALDRNGAAVAPFVSSVANVLTTLSPQSVDVQTSIHWREEHQRLTTAWFLHHSDVSSRPHHPLLLHRWGHTSANRQYVAADLCSSPGDRILWTKEIRVNEEGLPLPRVMLACVSNTPGTEDCEVNVHVTPCPYSTREDLHPCSATKVLSRPFRRKDIAGGRIPLNAEFLLCGRHQCLTHFYTPPQAMMADTSDLHPHPPGPWQAQIMVSVAALGRPTPPATTLFRDTHPYLNDISFDVRHIKRMMCREAALAEVVSEPSQCEALWFHHIAKRCTAVPSTTRGGERMTCVLVAIVSLGAGGGAYFGTIITSLCSSPVNVYVCRSKEYDRFDHSLSRFRSHNIQNNGEIQCPKAFAVNVVVTTITYDARTEVTSHWHDVDLFDSYDSYAINVEHVSTGALRNVPLPANHGAVTHMSLVAVSINGDSAAHFSHLRALLAVHLDGSIHFIASTRVCPSVALRSALESDGTSRSLFETIFSPSIIGCDLFADVADFELVGSATGCYELLKEPMQFSDSTTQVCRQINIESEEPAMQDMLVAVGITDSSHTIEMGTFHWSWRGVADVIDDGGEATKRQMTSLWTAFANIVLSSDEFNKALNCHVHESLDLSSRLSKLDSTCTSWHQPASVLRQILAGVLVIVVVGAC